MAIRLANMDFNRDPATGRVRIVRSWHVDTEDEIEEAPEAFVMGYGFTGEIVAANWDPHDVGQGFQVDAFYEGISSGFPDGLESAVWSFRPAFEKEPVEKLPHIDYLIENYGGEEDEETGRVIFRRKLSREVSRQAITGASQWGLSFGTERSTEERTNPLYGLNESGWLSMSGVAVAKFVSSDASHLDQVGTIVDLPGNPPDFGIEEDRNWLKAPPIIDEMPQSDRGNRRLFDIELHFLLSPKGGWAPAVYRFIDV